MSKVYIISSYSDLDEHRAAVKAVISTLSSAEHYMSFEYIGLEYSTPETTPPLDKYMQAIDEAEYVILLVGWRYGFIPRRSSKLTLLYS